MNLSIGDRAKDKITGFSGVIMGECKYMTGCRQLYVLPKMTDDKYPDGHWFDDNRLVRAGEPTEFVPETPDDGPCATPPGNW